MKEAQPNQDEGRRTTRKHAALAADETGSRDNQGDRHRPYAEGHAETPR
jgi:hypothetical protein